MTTLSVAQRQFIDELAVLLVSWNMPNNAARLYGYLQLRSEPASLDEIARDLETSKSNAFDAARMLEQYGNAKRLSERGSKRVFFVAGDDPGTPLRRHRETLGKMSALITQSKDAVATGPVSDRLAKLAKFHLDLKDAMESVILPGEMDGDALKHRGN